MKGEIRNPYADDPIMHTNSFQEKGVKEAMEMCGGAKVKDRRDWPTLGLP